MEENEKKVYSVIGQVTIGTDEYRDLIEAVKDAEAKAAEGHERWWKYYTENSDLKKRIEVLEKSVAFYRAFVNSNEVVADEYRHYLQNREDEE